MLGQTRQRVACIRLLSGKLVPRDIALGTPTVLHPLPPPPGLRARNPRGGNSYVPINKRLGNFRNQPACTSSGLEIRKFVAKGWRCAVHLKIPNTSDFSVLHLLCITPPALCACTSQLAFQAVTSLCKVSGPFVRFCDSCGSRSAHSLHGAFT